MREFKGLPKLKGKSNDKGRHILKGWERPPSKTKKLEKCETVGKVSSMTLQGESILAVWSCVFVRKCVCVCVYSTELIRKVCVVDLAEEPIGKS